MKYCIDYRNGGMGSSVLTHVLYACNQVELDLGSFFSDTGHAHLINRLNKSELCSHHLVEFPSNDLTCIVELYSDNWYQLLEYKMSYAKWTKAEPTLSNLDSFFPDQIIDNNNQKVLWEDFYNNIKDPSWPECNNYSDVKFLPAELQEEICQSYQKPTFLSVHNTNTLIEFLAITYYDLWTQPRRPMYRNTLWYPLSDYISNSTAALQHKIIEMFPDWQWDQTRGNKFHDRVIDINQPYLTWLEKIKDAVMHIVNFQSQHINLTEWEKAAIVAKSCELLGVDPRTLDWPSTGCFPQESTVTLIKSLKRRIYHGKTI